MSVQAVRASKRAQASMEISSGLKPCMKWSKEHIHEELLATLLDRSYDTAGEKWKARKRRAACAHQPVYRQSWAG